MPGIDESRAAPLVEEGVRAAEAGDWRAAEEAFDRALAEDATHLGAAIGKLRCLKAGGAGRAEEGDELARQLIARRPARDIARLTAGGKRELTALERAHDTLAWNALHRTRTSEGLVAALEQAKAGLRLAHERPDFLVDTTVRILLALRRTDEAFTFADHAERRLADARVFSDLSDARKAWALTRTRAHDARAITASFQKKAHRDETFADIINRANRWLRALHDAGYRTLLEIELGDAGLAVRRVHDPIDPSAVRTLEEDLGFSFPPSYARFLSEVGGVALMNGCWDETTSPAEIADRSRELASLDMPNDEVWQAASSDLRLLRVAAHHRAEDWIYLCHFRDRLGEAPTFLRYHDEGALHYGHGLEGLEAIVQGRHAPAPRRGPHRPKADGEEVTADVDLADALGLALADEDTSQRDKLRLVRDEWAPRLEDASDEDALAALHVIRGRIKSKKLRGERDALISSLRRDGLAGDAPLPSVPESHRPDKPKARKKEAPTFDTFHGWLSERVDEMMDHALERLKGQA